MDNMDTGRVDDRAVVSNDYSSQDDDEDNVADTESELVGNPALPPDVDLDKLRGDRIGDTVYSGKWCIKTVMKLLQSDAVMKPGTLDESEEKDKVVDMEEELQNEVGALWDMTSNVEVCQYLQSVGAIESIYHIIANSRCPRATEMCVGMLANIATHAEMWFSLKNDTALFAIVIPLLGNMDQPVLLEVMRFFNTALSHQENSHCYDSLWDNGTQVTQELMRIMCGSTNGDLLKQTSEFIYLLMCLDEEDSRFNLLFADQDFMQAVLEASKEIGYKHASRGQDCMLEILHCFTTYQAGLDAIESCMEQIATLGSRYLKLLCHSLNLSVSSDMLSTIISLLNHVFCRNVVVRVELMSSSSLLHCVLKALVAVYRKLGLYGSISHPCSHSGNKTSSSSSSKAVMERSDTWESMTEEEATKPRDSSSAPSWSERAGAATPQDLKTPEVSPRHSHRIKELEVSWSERRISSPLMEGNSQEPEESWKRPRDRRMKRAKAKVKPEGEGQSSEGVSSAAEEEEEKKEVKRESDEYAKDSGIGDNIVDEKGDYVCDDEKKNEGVKNEQSVEEVDNSGDARRFSVDSTKSGGFSPSQNKLSEIMEGEKEDKDDGVSKGQRSTQASSVGQESKNLQRFGQFGDGASENVTEDVNMDPDTDVTRFSDDEDNGNSKKRRGLENQHEDGEDEEDDDLLNKSDCHKVNAKYNKLLEVLKEFLSDFFNNLRETLVTDEGVPVIRDLMAYLNKECRSTHIRAIIKCVGHSSDPSQPVGRLVHMAKQLNASRLETVLVASLGGLAS